MDFLELKLSLLLLKAPGGFHIAMGITQRRINKFANKLLKYIQFKRKRCEL